MSCERSEGDPSPSQSPSLSAEKEASGVADTSAGEQDLARGLAGWSVCGNMLWSCPTWGIWQGAVLGQRRVQRQAPAPPPEIMVDAPLLLNDQPTVEFAELGLVFQLPGRWAVERRAGGWRLWRQDLGDVPPDETLSLDVQARAFDDPLGVLVHHWPDLVKEWTGRKYRVVDVEDEANVRGRDIPHVRLRLRGPKGQVLNVLYVPTPGLLVVLTFEGSRKVADALRVSTSRLLQSLQTFAPKEVREGRVMTHRVMGVALKLSEGWERPPLPVGRERWVLLGRRVAGYSTRPQCEIRPWRDVLVETPAMLDAQVSALIRDLGERWPDATFEAASRGRLDGQPARRVTVTRHVADPRALGIPLPAAAQARGEGQKNVWSVHVVLTINRAQQLMMVRAWLPGDGRAVQARFDALLNGLHWRDDPRDAPKK